VKIHRKAAVLICWWMMVFLTVALGGSGAWAEGGPQKGGGTAVQKGGAHSGDAKIGSDAEMTDDFDLLDSGPAGKSKAVHVWDPLAPWNRLMFKFNDKMYFWVLKPVAKGYNKVIPHFFRGCIRNFFHNLGTPVRFANCLLQAKGKRAFCELGQFICNSTVGILGFGNPARKFPGLKTDDDEDLGQTLGRYGIGQGIYIVWPILGPSTLRDSLGLVGDAFLEPVNYIQPWEASLGVSAEQKLNRTSLNLGQYEAFKASAIEPYTAARDAYIQYRRGEVEK